MANAIKGIDHCVILVRDLDVAHQKMSALGFTLTPRGVHSAHIGTANHCIMLRQAYFEVLSVRTPTDYNASWRAKLTLRQGLDAVPIASDDVEAARAQLMARGMALPAVIDFSRPVDLPEGTSKAAFRLVMIPEEYTPHITMFAIQHFTREVVRHSSYLDHPNGAVALTELVVCVEDVNEAARRYARYFGIPITRNGMGVECALQPGKFILIDHTGLREAYGIDPPALPFAASFTVAVTDLRETQNLLEKNRISLTQRQGKLMVAGSDAHGANVIFEPLSGQA